MSKDNLKKQNTKRTHIEDIIVALYEQTGIVTKIEADGSVKFIKKYNDNLVKTIDKLCDNGILSLSKDGEYIINDDIQRVLHQNDPIKMSWNNPDDVDYVDRLVKSGKDITLRPYLDNTVMYMFITSLSSENDSNKNIICKIGKTDDLVDRLKSLRKNYECGFFLCRLKLIKNKSVEIKFHKEVKSMYKELFVDTVVNGKSRNGIYILSPKLVAHFDNIPEYDPNETLKKYQQDNYFI